jgi:hypothetical protein
VFALPIFATIVLVAYRRPSRAHARLGRALTIAMGLVVLGAAVAATDARNAQAFNPPLYGSVFVAAALPAGIAAAGARDDSRRTSMLVLATILAFPVALLIAGLGQVFVMWAVDHGLPATW